MSPSSWTGSLNGSWPGTPRPQGHRPGHRAAGDQIAVCQRDRDGHPIEPVELIGHRDTGSRDTSSRFTEHLAPAGVEPSIGSVGDAYDNALMEFGIGLYKSECIRNHGVPCRRPSRHQRRGVRHRQLGSLESGAPDDTGTKPGTLHRASADPTLPRYGTTSTRRSWKPWPGPTGSTTIAFTGTADTSRPQSSRRRSMLPNDPAQATRHSPRPPAGPGCSTADRNFVTGHYRDGCDITQRGRCPQVLCVREHDLAARCHVGNGRAFVAWNLFEPLMGAAVWLRQCGHNRVFYGLGHSPSSAEDDSRHDVGGIVRKVVSN